MIYTITFNPALDYVIEPEKEAVGNVRRTVYESILPGGKGINVSIMLKRLGIDNTALGFVAGFTGQEIDRLLTIEGVRTNFVTLGEGMSRINVKIRSDNETEINARGPKISADAIAELKAKLDSLKDGDALVLAGSVPSGVPNDIYSQIIDMLSEKDIKVVIDAEGALVLDALRQRPFLIKPNHHELGAMFGKKLETIDEIAEYAAILREKGARNVFVSMAGDGGILAAEDGSIIYQSAPKGTLVNSTGAGDSSVAGFLAGYQKSNDYETALLTAICAGSATAFSAELATKDEVTALLTTISKEKTIYIRPKGQHNL